MKKKHEIDRNEPHLNLSLCLVRMEQPLYFVVWYNHQNMRTFLTELVRNKVKIPLALRGSKDSFLSLVLPHRVKLIANENK